MGMNNAPGSITALTGDLNLNGHNLTNPAHGTTANRPASPTVGQQYHDTTIGITVFSGMLASTCLAVLFVPSFFVVIQGFEEWLAARKTRRAAAATPAE